MKTRADQEYTTVRVPAWAYEELQALRAELMRGAAHAPGDLREILCPLAGEAYTRGSVLGVALRFARQVFQKANENANKDNVGNGTKKKDAKCP